MTRYCGIALLLTACIFLSAPRASGEDERLYSKDEIVATIPPENEGEKEWELKYADSLPEFPAQWEYFVTLHTSQGGSRPDRLSVYTRANSGDHEKKGYRLVKRMFSEETQSYAWFGKPSFFFYEIEGGRWHYFLHVPMFYSGTGHFRKDWVFYFEDGELHEVEFEPAPVWFKSKLNEGEGVWKGEHNHFSSAQLSFSFMIWNAGDGNGHPTAGSVKGTYKIVNVEEGEEAKKHEKLKMVVDQYERHTVEY